MSNKHSSRWWLTIPIYALSFCLILIANIISFFVFLNLVTFLFKNGFFLSSNVHSYKGLIISIIICVLMIGIDVFSVVYHIYRVKQKKMAKIKRLSKMQKRQEKENYIISIQNCLDSLSRKEIGKIDFSNIQYKYLPDEYHWAKQKQEQEERSGVSKRTIKLEDLLQ